MAQRYKWESWNDLLKLRDFVVFDVETTGFSPEKEKIIEIGMFRIRDGNVVDTLHSLIYPEKPIPTRITNLTGISDADVETAPKFQDIAQKIADFIQDDMLVAHNGSFDAGFLEKEFSNCGIKKNLLYFDTLQLARKAYPKLENHKLETLVAFLNLAESQSHRALDDAEQTWKLFQAIYEQYNTPLARAVANCCSPMTDYQLSLNAPKPLDGKHFVLMGDYTFSLSAAKKLIDIAGGTADYFLSAETDYLLYGYFDRFKHPPEEKIMVEQAVIAHQAGAHTKPINEVAFLKMCGVTFNWSDE